MKRYSSNKSAGEYSFIGHNFPKTKSRSFQWIALLAVNGLALIYVLTSMESASRREPNTNLVKFHLTRRCVANKLLSLTNKQIWSGLVEISDNCSDAFHINQTLRMEGFENRDEIKYMVLPSRINLTQFECKWVTLGIGQDIVAEQRAKTRIPKCQFYGADPSAEGNAEVFGQVGKFFEMAVGANRKPILTNVWYPSGSKWLNMTQMDLATFLTQHVGEPVLDQLTIDVEGGEFDILRLLASRNNSLDVSICQFNVEMHNFADVPSLKDLLIPLLTMHKWVLLRSSQHKELGHFRLFFFNYGDRICIERYFGLSDCPIIEE